MPTGRGGTRPEPRPHGCGRLSVSQQAQCAYPGLLPGLCEEPVARLAGRGRAWPTGAADRRRQGRLRQVAATLAPSHPSGCPAVPTEQRGPGRHAATCRVAGRCTDWHHGSRITVQRSNWGLMSARESGRVAWSGSRSMDSRGIPAPAQARRWVLKGEYMMCESCQSINYAGRRHSTAAAAGGALLERFPEAPEGSRAMPYPSTVTECSVRCC